MSDACCLCHDCTPSESAGSSGPSLEQARSVHERLEKAVRIERRAVREIALAMAEMQESALYRALGYAGLVEYGEQAFDFGPRKSMQLAALGRKLPELPLLDLALSSGALGWTKARALCPVITPETERAWVERATKVTSRVLEEQVAGSLHGAPPPEPEGEMESPCFVWARMRMHPLHFERIMITMKTIRHHFGDANLSPKPDVPLPLREVSARGGFGGGDRGGGAQDGTRESAGGRRARSCTRESAGGRRGRAAAGIPGHTSKTIPPAARLAALVRDGFKCQVPGCRNEVYVQVHHVKARSKRGGHGLENLVTACSAHHRMTHRGIIACTANGDGTFVWTRGAGEPLGLELNIDGWHGELSHAHLAWFEGPEGSWKLIEEYFGPIAPPAGFRAIGSTHVYPDAPIAERYPRGQDTVRIGDETDMAPLGVARNIPV
jgi:hypothetical protein